MKKYLTIFTFLFAFCPSAKAQVDSIFDQNIWRTFIVHLPTGYTTTHQYPVVLNLHGYNSDASQQQSYTQFDQVADTLGFIVIYPNGIANSWAINGNSDVDFLSHLVDTIRANYSCNTCLFVTGMSDGGFMTYKFACATSQTVSAIAIGSGNMSKTLQNASSSAQKIPVMHFHGTADPIVNYNGVNPIIPPVDSTVKWWVNHNNCISTPVFTSIPDINIADSSTVEKYFFANGTNGSEVTFYKVINGGHTWSGAIPAPPLGFTNQDINQSSIIGSFFYSYCSVTSGLSDVLINHSINIFPNPFFNQLTINISDNDRVTFSLFDAMGRIVLKQTFSKGTNINTDHLADGMYFFEFRYNNGLIQNGKIIKQ